MEEKTIQETQKENVKLSINAKGNYQWEIKIIGTGQNSEVTEADLQRLEQTNKKIQETYGMKY